MKRLDIKKLLLLATNCTLLISNVSAKTADISKNIKSNTQCVNNYYLYATHPQNASLTVMQINPATGDAVKKYDIPTVISPGDLNIHQNKHVYTFGNWDRNIRIYDIQSDGNLKQVQDITIIGDLPFNISFDHSGGYMYLAGMLNDSIGMYKVDQINGTLSDPIYIKATGNAAGGFNMNPNSDDFAYVTNYYEDTISVYGIDSKTHILTPLNNKCPTNLKDPAKCPTGTYPRLAWFDKHNHAYVLNLLSNNISMFNANPKTGELTPLEPSTIDSGIEPITFALAPSEKYAYVGTRQDNLIWVYDRDESTGLLTHHKGLPTVNIGGNGTRNATIGTFNGTSYLYVSQAFDAGITKFRLDANGLIESNTRTSNDTGVLNPEVLGIAHVNTCN